MLDNLMGTPFVQKRECKQEMRPLAPADAAPYASIHLERRLEHTK